MYKIAGNTKIRDYQNMQQRIRIITSIRKILNKYPKALFHLGKKMIQHPHYVYIIEQRPKSSEDMSINSKFKNKLFTIQNF